MVSILKIWYWTWVQSCALQDMTGLAHIVPSLNERDWRLANKEYEEATESLCVASRKIHALKANRK